MAENCVELIQRVLDGEEEAFSILVNKYEKRTHAHAWKIIGDYHIAQEITQDTFLQVYKKLHTLRNPKQFDGWLYVITRRLCITWMQRNKSNMESLEKIPTEELQEIYYRYYELELLNTNTIEHQRELVKKLLSQLPESERTVVTLYYIGEMTPTEISKYLGVSLNTIKARLLRAHKRLRAKGKSIITETVGSVQLSTDLTESIMKQIQDIKPEPVVTKPFLPWAAIGASFVLVLLLLGAMNQYIIHFQQPYNFEAVSEPTIEIVESPITVNILPKTIEPKRLRGNVSMNINNGTGSQASNTDFTSNVSDNSFNILDSDWSRVNKPMGDSVFNIFTTSEDNLYAASSTGMYKLDENLNTWINISTAVPIKSYGSPITEYQGVFYAVDVNRIFSSTDKGETWDVLCPIPNGKVIGLIISDQTQKSKSQESFVMYIAFRDKGVFQSVNAGAQWLPINGGLVNKKITTLTNVDNFIYAGTNQGLYRLSSRDWELLPVDPGRAVHSLAFSEENLYVATGPDYLSSNFLESEGENNNFRKIFYSDNLGTTWTEITTPDKYFKMNRKYRNPTKISVYGNTLLVMGFSTLRSKNRGKTWEALKYDINAVMPSFSSVLAINENTFYKADQFNLYRSIDSGNSWQIFLNGIVGSKVLDIIAFNNKLYIYTGREIYESTNNGKAWRAVFFDFGNFTLKPSRTIRHYTDYMTELKWRIVNNVLYVIIPQKKEIDIFRLQIGEDAFTLIHTIPTQDLSIGNDIPLISGGFAVSGNLFYIEYKRKIFKWDSNSSKLMDTGLMDTDKYSDGTADGSFKLTASANTVYVGRHDGRLFQSIDTGNSWQDITSNLPFSISNFKDIVFLKDTIYVATTKGVLASQIGQHWNLLTDNDGTHTIIDKITTSGSQIYGANDRGIYSLDHRGKWEQIYTSVPDKVINLTFSNGKLYIATDQQGIFQIPL